LYFKPLERRSKGKNGNVPDLILQIHSDVCRNIDISILIIIIIIIIIIITTWCRVLLEKLTGLCE